MPELLDDSAYRTGYVGKWHLGDEVFAQHGFEEWVSIEDLYIQHFSVGRDKSARSSYHHFLEEHGYKPDAKNNVFSRGFACHRPVEHCKPAFMAREASRFILDNRSSPWMLYINFLEPHMPFFGPYDDLHSEAEAPVPDNCGSGPVEREPASYASNRERTMDLGKGPVKLNTPAAWQRLNRNYAGLCSQVDQALGRILWALESSGQAGNTIIVFTSDHGDQMGAHSLVAKGVMYEESVRVPLLLHVPFREQKPARFESPVSHIDLVPTILDLLGRRKPDDLPGKSLIPVLEGKTQQDDAIFCEWNTRGGSGADARAIFTDDGWKLAVYDTGNSLLFNRREDALELHNLYYRPEHRDTVQRLRHRIERWQAGVNDRQQLPEPS